MKNFFKINGETIKRLREIERLAQLEIQVNPELDILEARKIAVEKYELSKNQSPE